MTEIVSPTFTGIPAIPDQVLNPSQTLFTLSIAEMIQKSEFDNLARQIIHSTDCIFTDYRRILLALRACYPYRVKFTNWNGIVRIVERHIKNHEGLDPTLMVGLFYDRY